MEHIIREQNILAAYDILELFCELVAVRLPIIEAQKYVYDTALQPRHGHLIPESGKWLANLIGPPGGSVDIKLICQSTAGPEMSPSSENEEFLNV